MFSDAVGRRPRAVTSASCQPTVRRGRHRSCEAVEDVHLADLGRARAGPRGGTRGLGRRGARAGRGCGRLAGGGRGTPRCVTVTSLRAPTWAQPEASLLGTKKSQAIAGSLESRDSDCCQEDQQRTMTP